LCLFFTLFHKWLINVCIAFHCNFIYAPSLCLLFMCLIVLTPGYFDCLHLQKLTLLSFLIFEYCNFHRSVLLQTAKKDILMQRFWDLTSSETFHVKQLVCYYMPPRFPSIMKWFWQEIRLLMLVGICIFFQYCTTSELSWKWPFFLLSSKTSTCQHLISCCMHMWSFYHLSI
jgi:hypothetical protein